MRLFAKIFLCTSLVICLSLLVSGYLLITSSFRSSIEREVEHALGQYQADRFQIQVSLFLDHEYGDATVAYVLGEFADTSPNHVFFMDDFGREIYGTFPYLELRALPLIMDDEIIYEIVALGDNYYILISGSILSQGERISYLSASNVTMIINLRQEMVRNFTQVYFVALIISMLIILVFTSMWIRPLKQMNEVATQIADGSYGVRIPGNSKDEIGELAESFNTMADAIEKNIQELERNATQKESFVANFAHELKTPLTSIIGYADTLYQRELDEEQMKIAARYILDEGLRLEALSTKLLELIVLGRRDFPLEQMEIRATLNQIMDSIRPVLQEKEVKAILELEVAEVLIEYDLFKTLFLNIIDNAIKAEAKEVRINGRKSFLSDASYTIVIGDNGHGIPESELSRITEEFYMVDKSRKRTAGAGLGLSLASKIAEIHGSKLQFKSIVDLGTSVQFDLRQGKELTDEEIRQ